MISHFNEQTSWEIREQILKYHATSLMSDLERAKFLGLPEGCRIRENAKIISQEKLKIGKNCWIGEGAILDASGGLEIGDNVQIGLNTFIWTHESYISAVLGIDTLHNKKFIQRRKTVIGSNCAISGPSVVLPGVTIGDKCVVAPMSVVYEDLPNNTVYKPFKKFYDIQQELEEKNKLITQMQQDLEYIKSKLDL